MTLDQLNFMQTDLTSSRKAMHELLAIVKEIAAERKVSFGLEIELIPQLATGRTKCILETSTVPVQESKPPKQDISPTESGGTIILSPIRVTSESHVGRARSSNIAGNVTPNLELFSTGFSEAHETHEYKRSSSPVVSEFPNVEDEMAPVAYSIPGRGGIGSASPKLPCNA